MRSQTRERIRDAAKRSAKSRQCPKCLRKGALKRDQDVHLGSVTYCRWPDCGYERLTDPPSASLGPRLHAGAVPQTDGGGSDDV